MCRGRRFTRRRLPVRGDASSHRLTADAFSGSQMLSPRDNVVASSEFYGIARIAVLVKVAGVRGIGLLPGRGRVTLREGLLCITCATRPYSTLLNYASRLWFLNG